MRGPLPLTGNHPTVGNAVGATKWRPLFLDADRDDAHVFSDTGALSPIVLYVVFSFCQSSYILILRYT
jgi:hypothetical protein